MKRTCRHSYFGSSQEPAGSLIRLLTRTCGSFPASAGLRHKAWRVPERADSSVPAGPVADPPCRSAPAVPYQQASCRRPRLHRRHRAPPPDPSGLRLIQPYWRCAGNPVPQALRPDPVRYTLALPESSAGHPALRGPPGPVPGVQANPLRPSVRSTSGTAPTILYRRPFGPSGPPTVDPPRPCARCHRADDPPRPCSLIHPGLARGVKDLNHGSITVHQQLSGTTQSMPYPHHPAFMRPSGRYYCYLLMLLTTGDDGVIQVFDTNRHAAVRRGAGPGRLSGACQIRRSVEALVQALTWSQARRRPPSAFRSRTG